ncbi:MAG: DUF6057 family protein, partial [Phycisphaerales bacterium]
YARYGYHLPLFMGALASVLFASLYVQAAGRARSDAGVFIGLSAILYLAGAAAFLPFAALCAAYELGRRRWRQSGLYLIVGFVLPYVLGVLVYRISVVNAYTELLPVSWRIVGSPSREKMVVAAYVAYLFPIAGVLAATFWRFLADGRPAAGAPHAGAVSRFVQRPAAGWALGTFGLFVVGGAAAALSPDGGQRALLKVHDYACRRMWPEVLAAANRCPANACTLNAVDRALYHTGQLGRDMFLYAQQPEALVVTGDDHAVTYWHAFDTLMDLGLVNLAEKNLTECLETFGEQPMILQRLAMVSMVKGRTEAARIYLSVLRKTLFHDAWAREKLAVLDADPSLVADAEIQRLRVRYYRPDSPAEFYDRETMLNALIEPGETVGPQPQPGSRNRMAFEYLTAWYLLKGNLPKFAQQVERRGEFGCTEIPPLWQEAIVIYAYGTDKMDVLRGLAIDPEVERRFKNFSGVAKSYGSNMAAAIPSLARDYRGSYFFYYFCTKVANR